MMTAECQNRKLPGTSLDDGEVNTGVESPAKLKTLKKVTPEVSSGSWPEAESTV